jgi:hypothetical protein
VLVLISENRTQKGKQCVQFRSGRALIVTFVQQLNDLFDNAQHQRARVEIDVELLEKLENVGARLVGDTLVISLKGPRACDERVMI